MSSNWMFAPADVFLHGCLSTEEHADGWVSPQRFLPEQRAVLESCLAWHPGLYKQMAICTSGVTLEFLTDATLVTIDLRFGEEPAGTASSRELVERHMLQGGCLDQAQNQVQDQTQAQNQLHIRKNSQVFDGISYEVNGHHKGMLFAAMQDGQTTQVHIALPESKVSPACLFEMKKPTQVRVYLPALRACEVRTIGCNGILLEPRKKKESLLVLGDSITQGFVCGNPAHAWACQLARHKKLDLINQGIGGQVFLPQSLQGFFAYPELVPYAIVVSLGINYRYESCRAQQVYADIQQYFATICKLWPTTPIYALTPVWHQDGPYPTHKNSCFEQVSEFIQCAVAPYSNITLVDGATLLDGDTRLLADGFEHPNKAGHTQIAERLVGYMQPHRCSRKLRPSAVPTPEVPASIGQMSFDL